MSRILATALIGLALCVSTASAATKASEIRWYSETDLDEATETAKKLGRPMALMLQDSNSTCPKHNAHRAQWKRQKMLEYFVCVMIESGSFSQFMAGIRAAAPPGKEGDYIPILFLATYDGKYLDVVPYPTSTYNTDSALKTVLKKFGPIMPIPKAVAAWKKLESARKLWEEKKYSEAMALYVEIKALEKTNPKLPIFAELKQDEKDINDRASELLAQANQLLQDGKIDEARAMAKKICTGFKGFDVCKDANDLLKKMPPPKDAAQ